jgi:hypothetical protein
MINQLQKQSLFARRAITSVALAISSCGLLAAGTIDYNVTSGWSNSANPNGVWSYDYLFNSALHNLPYQSGLGAGTCFNTAQGISGGYANGVTNGGSPGCSPAMFLTTGAYSPSGIQNWAAGDVMIQTYDPTNGGSSGPANILWTAPVSGTVTISGSLWYALNGLSVNRTDAFSLTLASSLADAGILNSGVVGYNTTTGSSFASPLTYSDSTPLQVNAGDTIDLSVVFCQSSIAGCPTATSIAALVGVTLDIQETSSATPEPSTGLLALAGIAATALLGKRLVA